jgi:hypothetical protein
MLVELGKAVKRAADAAGASVDPAQLFELARDMLSAAVGADSANW